MTGYALGYGTNGFSNHRLDDALAVIADLGYTAVGLTLDHAHLDPYAADLAGEVDRVRRRLAGLGLRCVVETGARYLLDPRRKHHPTLLSDEPGPRVEFLRRGVRIAADLGAECLSFWSGVRPAAVPAGAAWDRLRAGVAPVLAEADRRGVRLALEPEPGMLVAQLAEAIRLRAELGGPPLLGVTLDVGHCVAVEPEDAAACIRRAGPLLANVQLDDMRAGVHEHLEFGAGELDLPGTLAALAEVGFTGVAAVELPRHAHAAPEVAARAITALWAAAPIAPAGAGGLRAGPAAGPADDPAVARPAAGPGAAAHRWLAEAEQAVRADPAAVRTLFPAAGRAVGRRPLRPVTDPLGLVHGTEDDFARARLVAVLAAAAPAWLATELADLYWHGDDAERRGVLYGLSTVADPAAGVELVPELIELGLTIVRDALRSNDVRLVAAALSRFGADWLDQHSWRHGVLKCLFLTIPLAAVADLDRRADAELGRMVADYVAERRAAGRDVPADAIRLVAAD